MLVKAVANCCCQLWGVSDVFDTDSEVIVGGFVDSGIGENEYFKSG